MARDAAELEAVLKDSFKPLFKTVIRVQRNGGALWAQMDILGLTIKSAKQTCYFVHYPHSVRRCARIRARAHALARTDTRFRQHMVYLSIPAGRYTRDAVDTALMVAFGCESMRVVNCSGTDFDVLTDLSLYPLSQGQFGAYRLHGDLLDTHPLGGDEDERAMVAKRRRVRVQDREGSRKDILAQLGYEDQAWASVRHSETGGATSDKKGRFESVGSGALNREQRAMHPIGTDRVSTVGLDVNAPLAWRGQSIGFACAVELNGTGVMAAVRKLEKHGLVIDKLADALGDASTVIDGALSSNRVDKRGRPRLKKDAAVMPDAAATPQIRAVKIVAV